MVASIGKTSNSNNPALESSSRPPNEDRKGRAITTNSGQTSITRIAKQLAIGWMFLAGSGGMTPRISRAEAKPLNGTPSGRGLSDFVNGLGGANATAHKHVPTYRNNASTAARLNDLNARQAPPPPVPACPAPVVPPGTAVPSPTPLTGSSGIPILGPNNLPVVRHPYYGYPVELNPDGTLAKNANGDVPILDCEGKATGQVVPPGKPGDPVLSDKGLPLNTPEGFAVVYDDKLNPVAVNNGMIVADQLGNPYLVGNDGNWVRTPDEHYVVLDKSNRDKPIAADINGNTIGDSKGNPYALASGQGGTYVYLQTPVNNLVAYDKSNNHNPIATDRYGNGIMDQRGNLYALHEDGRYQTTPDGCRYFVYDKHNGNAIAPAIRHSADVIDYINKNFGTERSEPDKIKNEMFDESGFLNHEKLWKTVLKYDPRDVYQAILRSSNNLDLAEKELAENSGTKIQNPTHDIAVAMVAAYIQLGTVAENSPYTKIGELPNITFYEQKDRKEVGGIARQFSVGMKLTPNPDPVRIAAVLIHELNHALGAGGVVKGGLAELESLTEFVATLLTGITTDSPYETGLEDVPWMKYVQYWQTAVLAILSDPTRATGNKEDAVAKESDFPSPLADGSYPAIAPGQYEEGIKTLCRAYYHRDADALALYAPAMTAAVEWSLKFKGSDVPKLTGNESPACIPLTPAPPKPKPHESGGRSLSPGAIAGIAVAAVGAAALIAAGGGIAYHLMRKRAAGAVGNNGV